jgi:hypothetical protein
MSLPLFFALYCLEAGMFFTAVPWTRLWTLNAVLHHSSAIALWADNPYIRGFISGVGVVHVMIGVRELLRISRARRGSGAR